MNQATAPKTKPAALRDMITPPETGSLVSVALLFVLSLAALPLSGNDTLALIYAVAVVAALYLLSKSFSYVISLLLPAAVLYLISGAFTLSVLFTALLLGSCCGTILLLCCREPKHYLLWCAVPLLAAAAAYFVHHDLLMALLALLPLPLAVCGYLLVRSGTRQTTAIATLSGVMAVVLVVAGLVAMWRADLLHGNPVTVFADALRNSLSKALVEALAEMRTLYAEAGLELPITDELAVAAVSTLVNLLPGLFLAVTTLSSFFIWRAGLNFLLNLNMLPRIPLRMGMLDFSPVTAVVYILAFFTDLIANASAITLVGTAAANFMLILAPGLALLGYTSLSPRRGERRSCLSSLLFFGLILSTVTNPLTGVSLAALLGAANVLLVTFMPRKAPPPRS